MRYTVALLLLGMLCTPAWGAKVNGAWEVRGTLTSDGLRDIGTVETFTDTDQTPDVSTGVYWNTFTNTGLDISTELAALNGTSLGALTASLDLAVKGTVVLDIAVGFGNLDLAEAALAVLCSHEERLHVTPNLVFWADTGHSLGVRRRSG